MTEPERLDAPDLSTPEGLKAYRAELRRVGAPWRVSGFILIIAAAILLLLENGGRAPDWAKFVAFGGLIGGWALLTVAIFKRTAYHRRRLSST